MDAVEAELGPPGVLVNNAAGNFPVPAEDLSPNGWRAVVDSVLNGTFFCSREFGRRHIAAGRPGCIVNIGASYAWTGGPGFAHSAAAKAGVKNLTETLAVEWAPKVRVVAVTAGMIQTELSHLHYGDEAGLARVAATVPLERMGTPRDVGDVCLFLASPLASYVSGASVLMHGGGEKPAFLDAARSSD